ncbi:hypothetical protein GQ55_5G014900 [Panicum hallii var. hallii]|uniref:Uncharacterized protein n=1 Tax=Panicum hallii var. hallii TaxID=1504633 RepID=A0A2T7DBH7_9POAL|nr:hypothetical protein GQ55_5G014900 [Panicum hallii var. hallii]
MAALSGASLPSGDGVNGVALLLQNTAPHFPSVSHPQSLLISAVRTDGELRPGGRPLFSSLPTRASSRSLLSVGDRVATAFWDVSWLGRWTAPLSPRRARLCAVN